MMTLEVVGYLGSVRGVCGKNKVDQEALETSFLSSNFPSWMTGQTSVVLNGTQFYHLEDVVRFLDGLPVSYPLNIMNIIASYLTPSQQFELLVTQLHFNPTYHLSIEEQVQKLAKQYQWDEITEKSFLENVLVWAKTPVKNPKTGESHPELVNASFYP